MRKTAVFAAGVALFSSLAAAGPGPAEWATRSIYQVMTDRFARPDGSSEECPDLKKHCGGAWAGLIDNLDYIQGMGFTAVQISPVVENIKENTEYGEAYHGYWVNKMYAINENFGTTDDLKRLAQELHDRDMFLMVDVVINNMAQAIDGKMPDAKIDYANLNPFDDEKFYHKYCNINDYEDPESYQPCWLKSESVVALPDLATESEEVTEMIDSWITELVSNYSIDGLRIDAAKHISDEYLPPFVEAAGVFTFGEVYSEDLETVCRYQQKNLIAGLPNFGIYFQLIQAFTNGKMEELADRILEVEKSCNDTSVLGTFAENHDLERFASFVDDMALAKNALAFTILTDGIPTVYQGQEQHMTGIDAPDNRAPLWSGSSSGTPYDTEAPLYKLTATLNTLRNHAIKIDSGYVSEHSNQLYVDPSTMVTRKGPDGVQIVAVFSNQGEEEKEYELVVGPDAFQEGTEVTEVLNCTVSNANEVGNLTAQMGGGSPKVFFPTAQMEGSGLCGYSSDNQTATRSSSSEDPEGTLENTAMDLGTRYGSWLLTTAIAMGYGLL